MKFNFTSIQALGRALMLPIAMLPVAGLLLRLGQPDLLNIVAVAEAGGAIFSNLPLLFAIGVAVGFANDNNGAAGLAGAVGYLIMTAMLKSINKDIDTGVFGGIIIGSCAGFIYNKYKDIKLPEFLAFFGGKRFVPIATGVVAVILGGALGIIWPPIQSGLHIFSQWMATSGGVGLFLFGFFNRLFLSIGLHHVLNSLFWFQLGDFINAQGAVVHGDIARFMAGDPTAGEFMAGFFPIMMFGLPALCLAMYTTSHQQNRKMVAGLLLSMALTSFLTGITEPIEYSFIFLAPVLYLFHAILTGLSMAIMAILHVRLGFSFSAGAIDYVLFYKLANNPLLMLPVGVAMFIIYYVLGVFFIRKFNLQTVGRESADDIKSITEQLSTLSTKSEEAKYIIALGGADNLVSVDACTTRLRLKVKSNEVINRTILKSLGAKGFVTPSANALQVILGPQAEIIAGKIREILKLSNDVETTDYQRNVNKPTENSIFSWDVSGIIQALGDRGNIKSISVVALTRVKIEIRKDHLVDVSKLKSFGILDVIDVEPMIKQLYVGNDASVLADSLGRLIS